MIRHVAGFTLALLTGVHVKQSKETGYFAVMFDDERLYQGVYF